MARFDEIFDNIVSKAKDIVDTAGEKTADAVETGRLRYRQNQVASEIKKSYAKLGAIVYEAERNGEDYDALIHSAVEDLSVLNRRYDQLEEALRLVGKPAAATVKQHATPVVITQKDIVEELDDLDCPICETDLEPLEEEPEEEFFEAPIPEEPVEIEEDVPEELEEDPEPLVSHEPPNEDSIPPVTVTVGDEPTESITDILKGLNSYSGEEEDKMFVEILDEEDEK